MRSPTDLNAFKRTPADRGFAFLGVSKTGGPDARLGFPTDLNAFKYWRRSSLGDRYRSIDPVPGSQDLSLYVEQPRGGHLMPPQQ